MFDCWFGYEFDVLHSGINIIYIYDSKIHCLLECSFFLFFMCTLLLTKYVPKKLLNLLRIGHVLVFLLKLIKAHILTNPKAFQEFPMLLKLIWSSTQMHTKKCSWFVHDLKCSWTTSKIQYTIMLKITAAQSMLVKSSLTTT